MNHILALVRTSIAMQSLSWLSQLSIFVLVQTVTTTKGPQPIEAGNWQLFCTDFVVLQASSF